jgi:hypothetical protein
VCSKPDLENAVLVVTSSVEVFVKGDGFWCEVVGLWKYLRVIGGKVRFGLSFADDVDPEGSLSRGLLYVEKLAGGGGCSVRRNRLKLCGLWIMEDRLRILSSLRGSQSIEAVYSTLYRDNVPGK